MDAQVNAVGYPTNGVGNVPHQREPHKRILDVISRRGITLSSMQDHPNRRTSPGLAPVQWRRPATVVEPPPASWAIVAVLACTGLLSLVLALLVAR